MAEGERGADHPTVSAADGRLPSRLAPEGASRERWGVAYAAGAYVVWGTFPLYFRALAGVPAPEILAHRIVWSAAFLVLLVTARGRWREVGRQLSPGVVGRLALSATLISTNWLIYIWAVNAGHVLDASLGYFVNPLVSVLLGVVFLREPLSRRQVLAIVLAAVGVGSLVVRAGRFPWIALSLATTFGLYGLIRKRVAVDATVGILTEVVVLAPLAGAWLVFVGSRGDSHFGGSPGRTALLAASGVLTAVPLMWFAVGVRRLRLATIGLLQYLNPTMQFAIAVAIFGEPLLPAHRLAFVFIWIALAIYTSEAVGIARRVRRDESQGAAPPPPRSGGVMQQVAPEPIGPALDLAARRWWDAATAAAVGVVVLAVAILPAVTQDPAYHQFADRRLLLGVPNALDVLSNLALTLAGALGLRAALRPAAFPDPRGRHAWVVLFAAVLATSAGSVWYHLAPTSPRLVWDRVPMVVGFMALVAALVGDRFGAAAGRRLLPRAVLAGLATVAWWWLGDGDGRGNLLPYLAVQLGALAAIPLLLVGRPRDAGPRAPWLAALGLYVLAKVLEDHDGAAFAALGVSGHTLKHLVAAGAVGALALEVSRRGRYRAGAGGTGGGGCRSSMLEKSAGGT